MRVINRRVQVNLFPECFDADWSGELFGFHLRNNDFTILTAYNLLVKMWRASRTYPNDPLPSCLF